MHSSLCSMPHRRRYPRRRRDLSSHRSAIRSRSRHFRKDLYSERCLSYRHQPSIRRVRSAYRRSALLSGSSRYQPEFPQSRRRTAFSYKNPWRLRCSRSFPHKNCSLRGTKPSRSRRLSAGAETSEPYCPSQEPSKRCKDL